MELGLGVHGEPGIRSADMRPAKEVAALLVDTLLEDTPDDVGSRAAVLLNGLGSTQYEEMLVLYKDVHDLLTAAGVDVYRPIVNEMVTSLDMAGCSLEPAVAGRRAAAAIGCAVCVCSFHTIEFIQSANPEKEDL